MTNTEHLMAIAAEVGVNVDELPDTLETTLLKAIIEKSGGDTSALPDNLKSTLYIALAECAGGGGGGGSGGGSAEKKWLLKNVLCTGAALNATGIVPEEGKTYLHFYGDGNAAPDSVAQYANGVLRFYNNAMSLLLEYTASSGWNCTDSFHALYGTTVSICEWE